MCCARRTSSVRPPPPQQPSVPTAFSISWSPQHRRLHHARPFPPSCVSPSQPCLPSVRGLRHLREAGHRGPSQGSLHSQLREFRRGQALIKLDPTVQGPRGEQALHLLRGALREQGRPRRTCHMARRARSVPGAPVRSPQQFWNWKHYYPCKRSYAVKLYDPMPHY